MFDLLKKKISGFIGALSKKEEKKEDELKPELPALEEVQEVLSPAEPPPLGVQEIEKKAEEKLAEPPAVDGEPEKKEVPVGIVEKPDEALSAIINEKKQKEKDEAEIESKIEDLERRAELIGISESKKPEAVQEAAAEKIFEPKLSIVTKIKGLFSPVVTIRKEDCEELFKELEISLLESDVSMNTAHFLIEDLRKRIIGKAIPKSSLSEEVRKEMAVSLYGALDGSASRNIMFEKIEEKKKTGGPLIVLFIGPNGMGKTTTIAKLAFLLKELGYSSVFSASDTFRAAAQEQIEFHARKLGVDVIKHKYGADPAAVAFDAVAHAKAKGVDVVLIDTAGRQETSHNLLKEMEKLVRVVKPDLRIFIGEAIAGQALAEQVKKFDEAVRLDGIILTKMDCDAKGGSALTVVHETKLPLLFVGLGQGYGDLKPFDPKWFVESVLS